MTIEKSNLTKYKTCDDILLAKDNLSKSALEMNLMKFIFNGKTKELYEIYDQLVLLRCVSIRVLIFL